MKNYTLKLYKNGGRIETFRTKKKKRFLKILRTINWHDRGVKRAYIKVLYGKKTCIFGCLCNFYNEGYYQNKDNLLEVFKYFDGEE